MILWAGTRPAPVQSAEPSLPKAKVVLGGQTFLVELADTPEAQSLGLGGRAQLAPERGMLFLYEARGRHSFWMKGMLIAIDMIWLDNSRIVHIEHRVPAPAPGTPLGALPTYQSAEPANAVLEIAAGRAAALALKAGDFARFDFSAN